MDWILYLLGAYVIYYLVICLMDLMSDASGRSEEEGTEIIQVKDMLAGKNFQPKTITLTEDVKKNYMQKGKADNSPSYTPQRVTGAIFAQGFEVRNYNAQLMRSGHAVFDGKITIR